MSVPGLNANQNAHAKAMIAEVRRRKLPARAAIILMETAWVESSLQIYANVNVPESMARPHEAVGSDHLSVGIMQQQVPMWGTVADCMDPARSAGKFLDRLVGFNWQAMSTGQAAQTVQVSAFPDRYQQQEGLATRIVNAYWNVAPPKPKPPTMEDPVIIIAAPGRGIATLVPGGKYHLDPREAAALASLAKAKPGAIVSIPTTAVHWDQLREMRGKL